MLGNKKTIFRKDNQVRLNAEGIVMPTTRSIRVLKAVHLLAKLDPEGLNLTR